MPDPPRTSLSGHLPMEDLVHTGWSLTQVDFVYLLFRQEQCPYPTDPYPIPFLLLGVVAQSHLVHTQTQSTWPELLKFYLILSAKRMSELRKDFPQNISKWLGWQVASATSLILKRALAIVALGAGLLEPFPESPKWQSSLLPSARASPGWPATPLVHFLGVGWDLTLLNSFHSTSLTVSLHIFFSSLSTQISLPLQAPFKNLGRSWTIRNSYVFMLLKPKQHVQHQHMSPTGVKFGTLSRKGTSLKLLAMNLHLYCSVGSDGWGEFKVVLASDGLCPIVPLNYTGQSPTCT